MKRVWGTAVTLPLLFVLVISAFAGAKDVPMGPARSGSAVLAGNVPPAAPSDAGKHDVVVRNITPLYSEPKLRKEGVWKVEDVSGGHDPAPLIYRTFYRPSAEYPNAVVYMMLMNMKHISARLYLGSAEPYRAGASSKVEDERRPQLLAVTNALWQTKHAGKGGIIHRGTVLKKMEPGVATIVRYKNESIDIIEWSDAIDAADVGDARQLKHLIVKDGKVVSVMTKRGKKVSAEIGLGSLLDEQRPVITVPGETPEAKPTSKLNFTSGDLWFLATRSAFGIREDGNLVFAVGHHIGTVDLAKALVLAGCVRAMHGDANPGNAVGVIYCTNGNGEIVKTDRLSPFQDRSTAVRYVKGSYPKDFFAFFRRLNDAPEAHIPAR